MKILKSQEQIENFITTGKDLFGRDLQFKMFETFKLYLNIFNKIQKIKF